MSAIEQQRTSLRRLASGSLAQGSDVVPLIRRGARIILLMLWIFALLAGVLSAYLLLHHARSHTAATAISLEQYARRTVMLAAFVVDEYEEFLTERGGVEGAGLDPANAERLATLVKWLPDGSAVGLFSPDGSYLASTVRVAAPPPKASDRLWFKAHAEKGLSTFIGPAILSRVSNRFVFTYSASYRNAAGTPLGIINLGIPSDSITGLAGNQHQMNMALLQGDGFVIAAQPFEPGMAGGPFPMPFASPATETTGYGEAFGRLSIIALRNIPDLDLHAVVAIPVRDVLFPLIWSAGIGLPLLLLLTNLLLVLSHQLQKKSLEVQQALADNKVLFQEVHHRVKNNLQVVSSLLRLQTERLPPDLRPILDETGARVRAIALVHEQIYRTASPSDVQLDRFLAQLVQQLAVSMIGGSARITTDLQPVTIGLDRAVPVAILASEAITNAIKHGLADGGGEIAVRLISKDGTNRLEVRDSGAGPVDGAAGLGTRIMEALSRQIDGEWGLGATTSGGTLFTLTWPASG